MISLAKNLHAIDDITVYSHRSTFSSLADEKPYAISNSFIFPGRITAMSSSQTQHGISTKALLGQYSSPGSESSKYRD